MKILDRDDELKEFQKIMNRLFLEGRYTSLEKNAANQNPSHKKIKILIK